MSGAYMNTSTVITHSKSREVARQVAATNARIKACYPATRVRLETRNVGICKDLYHSEKSMERICHVPELDTVELRRTAILKDL